MGWLPASFRRLNIVPGLWWGKLDHGFKSTSGSFLPLTQCFRFHRVLVRWDKFPFSTGARTVNLNNLSEDYSLSLFSFFGLFFFNDLFSFYYFNQLDGSMDFWTKKVCRNSYGAIEYVNKKSVHRILLALHVPHQFSSVAIWMPGTKRKPFEVFSYAGTKGGNSSNVVEDVFIVMLNVVSECVP